MVKEEKILLGNEFSCSLEKVDYVDCFSFTNTKDSIKDITIAMFGQAPNWVKVLFGIRNSLVKLVGVKSISKPNTLVDFRLGGNIVFFKIYNITEKEVELGMNDDHLNFRVIVYDHKKETQNISVSTHVQFHNTKGRLYFSVIKPFHKMIVKNMLKNGFETRK